MATNMSSCASPNATIDYSCEEINTTNFIEHEGMQMKFACDLVNAAILILVMPLILIGNSMVVMAVIKFRKLRTSMNLFIVSLSVSDMLVAFPTIPLYVVFFVRGEVLRKYKYLCLSRYAFVVASMTGSIISLTFVSFDRYIAVIHPLHYQTLMTKRRVRYMLFGIWVYDIVFSIMPLTGVNIWQEGMPCHYFRVFPKPYTIFTVPVTLGVCLVLSVSMYVRVFRVAKQHQERMKKFNVNNVKRKDINRRQMDKETRTAKVMAFVLLLFVIFWFPFLATSLLKYLPFAKTAFEIAKTFGVTIAMTNSVMNPIIYCWMRRDFQQAFKQLLCCKTVVKQKRNMYTTKALKANISWSLCSSDTASIENTFV